MSRYTEFQKLKSESIEQAARFEARGAYEMTYISIWRILEKGMRIYADDGVKRSLKAQVFAWTKYLDGAAKKQGCTETGQTVPAFTFTNNS